MSGGGFVDAGFVVSRIQIEALLTGHPEIEAAYLFGSLAKNTATPDSDADLAIHTTDKLTAEAKIQLIEELAQSTGRPIDLIDLRQAGNHFWEKYYAMGFA